MTWFDAGILVALTMLGVALIGAVTRIVIGPSMPDRIVAFDLLSALGVGFLAVYAVAYRQSAFLDVAMILALVSFLGATAFAWYLHRRPPE